jgi:hypothetical protein
MPARVRNRYRRGGLPEAWSVEINDSDEPLGESFCEFCPANGGRCAVCGHVHETPVGIVNVPGRFR